jgi:hypothetical protein
MWPPRVDRIRSNEEERSVNTRRSLCPFPVAKPSFMLLKSQHDLLQLILRKIDPVSLRQVWAAALEGQILVDELFEHLEHSAWRLSSHCHYDACASNLWRYLPAACLAPSFPAPARSLSKPGGPCRRQHPSPWRCLRVGARAAGWSRTRRIRQACPGSTCRLPRRCRSAARSP